MTEIVSLSTREAILDAAEKLFARYGYRKTTVEDLARDAGIAKGTIYLYFKSKEEIALARITRVLARLLENLEKISASPGPPLDRLRAVLRERVMFRVEKAQIYAADIETLLDEIRPALGRQREGFLRDERRLVAALLREAGIERAPAIATALIDATNAFLPSALLPADLRQPATIRKRLDVVVELLLSGLTATRRRF